MTLSKNINIRQPGAKELVAMMASLMALNALAIDTMLPAFPLIRESLNIGQAHHVQVIISFYLLGMGVGSIFYGPLSDRFGRRRVLLPAIAGYAVFSLACSLAPTFEILLAMRIMQGLCGAAMGVLVAAVIRDRFDGDKMARHMSTIFMTFMIVPIIAPLIGAAILQVADWHVIFDLFALLSLCVGIWIWRRLPETLNPANKQQIKPRTIIRNWGQVIADRTAISYVIGSGLVQGALFGYLNASEQLFSETFGARDFFPIGFSIIAIGIAVANFTNSRIVERFGARRVSHSGIFLFIALAIMQLSAAIWAPTSMPIFLVLLTANMAMIGFLGTNFSSIAMQPFGKIAGSASSFQQTVRTLMGGGIGALIGAQFDGSAAPIAAGFCLCGIGSLCLIYAGERGRLFTPPRGNNHIPM
jgi:DHA1 family bicyclomycin/chloramphenicol resistance-like MFS transporter